MDQGLLDGTLSILIWVQSALASMAIIVGLINKFLTKTVQFSRIIQYLWSRWSCRAAVLGIIVSVVLYLILQQPIARLIFMALAITCTIFVVYVLVGPARRILLQKPYHPKRTERFSKRKVIVGAKEFLEQDFLCEIVARVIENDNPDMTVERRFRGHGTWPVYGLLQDGEIDLYVEYTGTALTFLRGLTLEEAREKSPWEIEGLFRERNLIMLEPLGYDSGYVLVMLRQKAENLAIASISDLSRVSGELTFKGTKEFNERPDGFDPLQKEYGLYFAVKDVVLEENRYDALRNGEMHVTSGFAADNEIILEEDTFITLRDDRHFFPSGYAAPLVHQDLIDCFPRIEESLAKLAGAIRPKDIASLTHEGIEKGFDKRLDPAGIRILVNNLLKDKGLLKDKEH